MSFDAGQQARAASRPSRGRRTGTLHVIAVSALVLVLAGCSVIDKPVRAAVYDFGPGPLASAAAGPPGLPALTLAEVDAGAALDSTAVLYRLAYANAQQLLPYAQARWSMAPAELLRQRLRERIGQQRTVLGPDDANPGGELARWVLRVELEEFSQLFSAPAQSTGLVRLRATLVHSSASGDRLVGQRMVVAQRPASSADAPGGVRALGDATDAAVDELLQWLSQQR